MTVSLLTTGLTVVTSEGSDRIIGLRKLTLCLPERSHGEFGTDIVTPQSLYSLLLARKEIEIESYEIEGIDQEGSSLLLSEHFLCLRHTSAAILLSMP